MSQYQIKQYRRDRAQELNVKIKPSANPKQRIDVFDKTDKFIVSSGAVGYLIIQHIWKKVIKQ